MCVWGGGGGGGCNRQWPLVYTVTFWSSACSSHLHVHVAKAGLESLGTFAFY